MIDTALAGTVYYIDAPFLPWLWPLLAVFGLAFQIIAVAFKRKWLIWPGLALVMAGCFPERDLTLAVGDAIASLSLYYILRKK